MWSEGKSHLLTFLAGFLATVEGELPPWTELTQEKGVLAGIHRHHTQITGSLHRHVDILRKPAGIHTRRNSPSIGQTPPPPPGFHYLPSLLIFPSFRRPGKAATLSQQMARGRSWRVFGEDSSELFTRILCTQSKWRVYSGLSRLGQCVR